MSDILKVFPDCMMPDGADPCSGFEELYSKFNLLRAERDTLREVLGHARYAITRATRPGEVVNDAVIMIDKVLKQP